MSIKDTAAPPTLEEIIAVKVKAFGRRLVNHGSQAAHKLCGKGQDKLVFATDGATSSFRVGNRIVHLVRTSVRKMQLGDSPTGLIIRSLWHLGQSRCEKQTPVGLAERLGREDRRQLRLSAAIMPKWMRERFARFLRMDCLRRDWEPLPLT